MGANDEYRRFRYNMSLIVACCLCISTTITTATTTASVTDTAAATTSDNLANAAAAAVPGANRKRLALRSVDPLTRRSSVDKHFIRFGRNELDGEGAGDGDSGRYSPRASINLRKREIFQGAAINVGTRPRYHFDAQTRSLRLQSQPRISLAGCWSPSSAKSVNRTCFDRLRLLQHQYQRHRQQRNRPSYYIATTDGDSNLDSDNRLGNEYRAYFDTDASDTDTRNQFPASEESGDPQEEEEQEQEQEQKQDQQQDQQQDVNENDDDKYGIGAPRDYQRPGVNNASNDAFFAVNSAPEPVPTSGTSKFRADWKNMLYGGGGVDQFVRTSRNKFSRNLFSRYDRGRDNFMRLGRSKVANDVTEEKTLPPPPFVDEIDDDDDDDADDDNNELDENENDVSHDVSWSRTKRNNVQRFPRKNDSFMRLGRKHESNFMRLGRTQIRSNTPFIRYGRTELSGIGSHDRWTRKHDGFMRLGRNQSQRQRQHWQSKRDKAQNFMRLGRRVGESKPRQQRESAENFMRFGRRTISLPSSPLLTLSRFKRQPPQSQPDVQYLDSDRSSMTTGNAVSQTAAAAAADEPDHSSDLRSSSSYLSVAATT